ncbi:MAG: hypothetical protein IE937_01060 [Gammaproteobacteria bacterium]|nr:hypothetical protein [Gammaproteobacteria bacterium]
MTRKHFDMIAKEIAQAMQDAREYQSAIAEHIIKLHAIRLGQQFEHENHGFGYDRFMTA